MATKIVEGRKAPDFTLNDAGGKPVSLADFKGKNVIVYFYEVCVEVQAAFPAPV